MQFVNPSRSVPTRVMSFLLAAMALASSVLLAASVVRPCPIGLPGVALDRLSALLSLLVAGVGTVNFQFSRRYLQGEPGQQRFLNWLFVTVAGAYVLMFSTHLLLLFIAWSTVSFGLHRLLTFYADRPLAQLAARQKFIISRLGDACLLAAIGLIWRTWGTLDLNHITLHAQPGPAEHAAALLVVIAALTKSAQFPFHFWLPETMESPTPVSALMHAGVINAGGALLIRFAPLIETSRAAMLLLSAVGTLTMVLGSISMWAQVKVKRTLAWSTVAQMGFMMIQCGLGAFHVAALHIIGHGCYKAWSFLQSGELPPLASVKPVSPVRSLFLILAGTLGSVPGLFLASIATGWNPARSPGELALSFVLALSIGQLWSALLSIPSPNRIGLAILWAAGVPLLGFAIYRAAESFLSPVIGEAVHRTDPVAWVTAIIPVLGIIVLTVIHAVLPSLKQSKPGRAFAVHALHGFYAGPLADRIIESIWNPIQLKEQAHD